MENSSNKDLSFLAPIATLFTVAVTVAVAIVAGMHYKNKSDQSEVSAISNNTYSHPVISANSAQNISKSANYHNYDMSEPFAANVPFEFTPTAWMHMMNNMMNTMQITQIMHQMTAMPTQMMNSGMWVNPHDMLPNGVANQSQQPMDPKEYKKWYEQQLELQQSTK